MVHGAKEAFVWASAVLVVVGVIVFLQYHYRAQLFQHISESVHAPFVQVQERQAAQREAARRERVAAEAAARLRLEAEQEKQRMEREFERAFLDSYEEPAGCDSFESQRHMVECVNHRMRARQAFRAEFFGEEPGAAYLEATR